MSKVLSSGFILVIQEYKLEPIVTGLNSDHLNTNYGVENRRDKRKVQTNKWRCHRQAEDMSCAANLVKHGLLIAVNILSIDTEVAVLGIYRQFHIYTVSVS
jgi:hypothetical protein